MRTGLAHFTLNGTPLCDCQYVANHERLRAAGSPPCEGPIGAQATRFAALAEQFPGRVAMVHGACPSRAADASASAAA